MATPRSSNMLVTNSRLARRDQRSFAPSVLLRPRGGSSFALVASGIWLTGFRLPLGCASFRLLLAKRSLPFMSACRRQTEAQGVRFAPIAILRAIIARRRRKYLEAILHAVAISAQIGFVRKEIM